ncbi:MAG: sensory histidine kinase AtoS [Smithella sp. PtaU1.Bin162]|nr:MAG: sensory histidine kinase AtoS [Smithella sp. PtaU1.Bin162]
MSDVSSSEAVKNKADKLEQAAALFKESDARFKCLLETMQEGIVFFDQAGKVTFVNTALEKMLGLERNQIVGISYQDRQWQFLLADEQRNGESGDLLFDHVKKTSRIITGRKCIRQIAGNEKITLSVHAAPYYGEKGDMAGVVTVLTDVSDFKRIRNEVDEIKDLYERLTNYADEAIFRTRITDGKVIYINKAAERILC